MKYDFDTPINRRGTNSYKWDTTPEGVDAMWVADMDFRTAPCIIDALRRRVDEGIFGYTYVPKSYYDATTHWFAGRHGWTFPAEAIIYTSGVVPALSAIIKALTKPGDKVITQTPAYNCFFSSIRNNGCLLSANRLLYDQPTGRYSIDFDDLERRAADPQATLMILCNPHNPSGRVWSRGELLKIADICERHGVTVVADEIHCELVWPGYDYTPFCSLSPEIAARSVACVSPSKAFNIAGLQIANIVCENEAMRRRIDRAINDNEVCDVNPFGVIATQEAYNHGADWLAQLKDYIWGNYQLLSDFFHRNLPRCVVTPLEGTYLAWVNVAASGMTGKQVEEKLVELARVRLNAGDMYGPGGADFLRFNLACPRALLADALQRILDSGIL